jgi:uncharacterized RDD family membrane protein YckC
VFVAFMFIIIGGDGKEYGPVTADQVRVWINAGRANLDTKAKALGSEEWRRVGDFAEFAPPMGAPPMIAGEVPLRVDVVPATGLVPADRGARLLARLIDWAIEIACTIPAGVILGTEFLKLVVAAGQGKEPDFESLDVSRLILGAVVLALSRLALLIVQVWMLTTRGQSIGKRVTGIRIVRYETNGPPGIVHAWVLRELLFWFIGVFLSVIPFIGPMLLWPAFHLTDACMIFRDDQRCLHDLLAGTKVVKA